MGHLVGGAPSILDGNGAAAFGGRLRHVDPRTRIVAVTLFAVVVVALDDFLALTAALAVSVVFLAAARLPAARTLRRMAAMDGFILFMLVTLPFTVPGETATRIAGLTATWQGIEMAVGIALKANAIVLALLSLVGSMDSVRFGHALYRLRIPEKLVFLLIFTVRYVEVLNQEFFRLRTAMKARAFKPRNSLHTYRSYGYLIGMMLVRALERSERILAAMKCRGFSGRFPVLDNLRFGANDLRFGSAILAAIVVLFGLEVSHVAVFLRFPVFVSLIRGVPPCSMASI